MISKKNSRRLNKPPERGKIEMKKYKFEVYFPDDFIQKIRPKLEEAFQLKGVQWTDEEIKSLLEFCLMLGSYGHVERNLDRYLESAKAAREADRTEDVEIDIS
jgi:hypothetical protein